MRTQFQALWSRGRSRELTIRGRGWGKAGIAGAASGQKGRRVLWSVGQRRPSRSSEEPAGREGKGRASQQEAQHVVRS